MANLRRMAAVTSKCYDDQSVLKEYNFRVEKITECVNSANLISSNMVVLFKTCGPINANAYFEYAFILFSFLNLEMEALMEGTLVLDSREHLFMNEGYLAAEQRGSWKENIESSIALTKVCYQYLLLNSSDMVIFLSSCCFLS